MSKGIKKIIEDVKSDTADPKIDKFKESLKDLKGKTTAKLLKEKLPTLDAELGEIDILSQNQREALKKSFIRDAILKSPEAADLHAFVDEWAEYTGLDKAIEECDRKKSKKPLYRIVKLARASTPLLTGIGTSLMAWLNEGEKEDEKGQKPSKLETAATRVDTALAKADKKPEEEEEEEGKKKMAKTKDENKADKKAIAKTAKSSFKGGKTEVKSVGSAKYEINPKYTTKKLSSKEFKKEYLSIKNRKKRNEFVLAQIAVGNKSNAFKKLRIMSTDNKMSAVIGVSTRGLEVAGVPIQLDGPTAMAAALLSGCTLPDPWLVDKSFKAAGTKGHIPFIAAPAIAKSLKIDWQAKSRNDKDLMRMSPKFAIERAKLLADYRKENNISDDQLTRGDSKNIVHPVPGKTKKGMLEIYGGRHANGARVQPVSSGFHGPGYSDYANLLYPVKNTPKSVVVTENGKEKRMSYTAFRANKKYAKKFEFKAQELGTPYITPELQAFVDKNKQDKDKNKTS